MKRGTVNNYTVQTTPTLASAHFPGFCEGGSWSPLRFDPDVPPHFNDGTSGCLIPQKPIQTPRMHVPQRVDLHLPRPTAATAGLDKSNPFCQHLSLPRSSTAAPSQQVQRGKKQGRRPGYLHAPTRSSHLALASLQAGLPGARWLAEAEPRGGAGETGCPRLRTNGECRRLASKTREQAQARSRPRVISPGGENNE